VSGWLLVGHAAAVCRGQHMPGKLDHRVHLGVSDLDLLPDYWHVGRSAVPAEFLLCHGGLVGADRPVRLWRLLRERRHERRRHTVRARQVLPQLDRAAVRARLLLPRRRQCARGRVPAWRVLRLVRPVGAGRLPRRLVLRRHRADGARRAVPNWPGVPGGRVRRAGMPAGPHVRDGGSPGGRAVRARLGVCGQCADALPRRRVCARR
jgi:hypothetical protein